MASRGVCRVLVRVRGWWLLLHIVSSGWVRTRGKEGLWLSEVLWWGCIWLLSVLHPWLWCIHGLLMLVICWIYWRRLLLESRVHHVWRSISRVVYTSGTSRGHIIVGLVWRHIIVIW